MEIFEQPDSTEKVLNITHEELEVTLRSLWDRGVACTQDRNRFGLEKHRAYKKRIGLMRTFGSLANSDPERQSHSFSVSEEDLDNILDSLAFTGKIATVHLDPIPETLEVY